jgi:hypothetical protein
MEDELLGYLCEGRFLCRACTNDVILMDRRVTTTSVYRVNVWPYSQHCWECGYVVLDAWQRADGNGGLSLFQEESGLSPYSGWGVSHEPCMARFAYGPHRGSTA